MNAEKKRETSQASASGASAVRPDSRSVRKKKQERFLARLRAVMLAIGCMILIMGFLLVILPLFRVKEIRVSGNEYYSKDAIIEVCDVEQGDEMLALDLNAIRNRLFENFEHMERIAVRTVFPNVLSIEVVEKKNLGVTAYNGSYYTFDSNFVVLDERADAASLDIFPSVELPEISYLAVGEPIVFLNSEMDMGYVFELIGLLDRAQVLPHVTLLDCSRKYDCAVELNGNCRIEFGKVENVYAKLELAQEILVDRGVGENQCVVVNVSDPKKSTYRVLNEADFLSNG